jgi:hypothetical protein
MIGGKFSLFGVYTVNPDDYCELGSDFLTLVLIFAIITPIGLDDISRLIGKNGMLIGYLFKLIMMLIFKRN